MIFYFRKYDIRKEAMQDFSPSQRHSKQSQRK